MPNYTGRQRKLSDAEIIERYRQGVDAETVGIAAGCSGTTVLAIVRPGRQFASAAKAALANVNGWP